MPASQSAKSHARLDPAFHFSLIPVLVLNVVFAIWYTVRHWSMHPHITLWMIVMAVALLWMGFLIRIYSLKVQDRVIRLEERLRLAGHLPAASLASTAALTPAQYIALRFASDEEFPALAQRAAAENLTPLQIKQAISTWRPDHHRV